MRSAGRVASSYSAKRALSGKCGVLFTRILFFGAPQPMSRCSNHRSSRRRPRALGRSRRGAERDKAPSISNFKGKAAAALIIHTEKSEACPRFFAGGSTRRAEPAGMASRSLPPARALFERGTRSRWMDEIIDVPEMRRRVSDGLPKGRIVGPPDGEESCAPPRSSWA